MDVTHWFMQNKYHIKMMLKPVDQNPVVTVEIKLDQGVQYRCGEEEREQREGHCDVLFDVDAVNGVQDDDDGGGVTGKGRTIESFLVST